MFCVFAYIPKLNAIFILVDDENVFSEIWKDYRWHDG